MTHQLKIVETKMEELSTSAIAREQGADYAQQTLEQVRHWSHGAETSEKNTSSIIQYNI